MWIIKNLSSSSVELSDLQVTVGPKEYFDLDAVGRDKALESRDLQNYFKSGDLKTINKDASKSEKSLAFEEKLDQYRRQLMGSAPISGVHPDEIVSKEHTLRIKDAFLNKKEDEDFDEIAHIEDYIADVITENFKRLENSLLDELRSLFKKHMDGGLQDEP